MKTKPKTGNNAATIIQTSNTLKNYHVVFVLVFTEIKVKKVFLDLIFEYNKNGAGMTDTEIRDEINTFMFEVNVQ